LPNRQKIGEASMVYVIVAIPIWQRGACEESSGTGCQQTWMGWIGQTVAARADCQDSWCVLFRLRLSGDILKTREAGVDDDDDDGDDMNDVC